jgi:histone deacetylase complex regulatory component SIN3
VSQALSHAESGAAGAIHPTPQSQPVEFNHAINYVNKIKVSWFSAAWKCTDLTDSVV